MRRIRESKFSKLGQGHKRAPAAPFRGSPQKILIVDDSVVMRNIIKQTLQRIGFENSEEAGDGIEALGKLDPSYTLILTDMSMPGMSGPQFVKEVKAREDLENIPIIVITTESGQADKMIMMRLGVNEYITKPFTPEELKEKINTATGN